MMNSVCFISPLIYPLLFSDTKSVFGGAEVQMFLLMKYLVDNSGFRISCVTVDAGNEISDSQGIRIIPSYPVQSKMPSLLRLVRNTILFVRSLFKADADVYVQRNAGVETFLTALFCRLCKKRFVYMVSSDIDCDGRYAAKNCLRGFLFKKGVKAAYKVIAQTEEQKNVLRKVYDLDAVVLPNSYFLNDSLSDESEFILWVGRISEVKRPDLLLEIAGKHPEKKFVMIGGQSCSETYYADFCLEVGKYDNVDYIPYVAFNEIDAFFKKCTFLINTSSFEGFPNTFIQAWQFGKPVLSLGVDPDRLLSDKGLGRVFADAHECAAYLSSYSAEYQQLSQAGFEYAKEQHDISKNGERFRDILLEVMS